MSNTKKKGLPDRLLLVVGTYDGVICGFDSHVGANNNNNNKAEENGMNLLYQAHQKQQQQNEDDILHMSFAMAVHDASVRCLSIAAAEDTTTTTTTMTDTPAESSKKRKKSQPMKKKKELLVVPGTLLTGGYDDTLNIFNLQKYQQAGELKTPSDLGSPTCSAFAPPNVPSPGYAIVGTTSGKLVLYKRRDWSVQHILSGHPNGVDCIAVHPSGKMALSGGRSDGKLMLWDLMRGRLAFVHKVHNSNTHSKKKCSIQHIAWSADGNRYAYCTDDGNITVKSIEGGGGQEGSKDVLLDIVMTSRANQIAFIGSSPENELLAAACDDGSLPVFSIAGEEEERNAIMAIEPADSNQERFKCLRHVQDYMVVTANSHGICSIIDLQGAANMLLSDNNDDDDDHNEDEDFADIITSVRVGSGARITTMDVWSCNNNHDTTTTQTDDTTTKNDHNNNDSNEEEDVVPKDDDDDDDAEEMDEEDQNTSKKKRAKTVKVGPKGNQVEMDAKAVDKARKLIEKAKSRQNKKKEQKKKRKKQQH